MGKKNSFEFSAFLRAIFLILSATVFTAILSLPVLLVCFLDPSRRWSSFIQGTWAKWLLRANGIRLHVQGKENLEKNRPYLFISNHASILDIPAIICAFPHPLRFMAKKSLRWFPVFGWFLYFADHVLLDRNNAQSAVKSLKKASALLKNGISIIVFPEGTRTPDGEVKEFKLGAFLMAVRSRAALVPLSISGTFQMLPRTGWCFRPGTILIHVSPPIPTEGIPLRESRQIMDHVRETIIKKLKT